MKIVCLSTESVWSNAELTRLRKLGNFVQAQKPPRTEDEVIAILKDANYAVVAPLSFGPFSHRIFQSLPNLKGVSIVTTRFAWVDTKAAREKRIIVSNLPGYSTIAVGELALGLVFNVVRKISQSASSTQKGNRTFENFMGHELKGKTLGVVGCGLIGCYIANLGTRLGMEVVGWNRTPRKLKIPLVSIEQLLSKSDVVSVNLALNEETKGFLNRNRLSLLKPTAVVINVSPEDLIDQKAIYEMLTAGKLAGYGYEVDEGRVYPLQKELLGLTNVIATSHIGWYTPEAQQRIKDMTITNLEAMINGKPVNNVVV